MRNSIDLACMEGAVSSAMLAARALDEAANGSSELAKPLVPGKHSVYTMALLKIILYPVMVVVWLVSKLR